jgi:hypothetical protein
MKPLKINIRCQAHDGYLYGGRLFLVCNDGAIKSISLWSIIASNIDYLSPEYKIFKLAFDRNNWTTNSQAKSIFNIPSLHKQFQNEWNKFSDITYDFSIDDNELKTLDTIKNMPIFDFIIYGMRMFLGNRNGLHESGFSINGNSEIRLNEGFDKVIDSRVTNITAKAGSLMLSSNSDGLFHGQLWAINERLKVKQKPVQEQSLRSGWSGYDVINYTSQNSFDYLKNSYGRNSERKFLYSAGDEDSQKIWIDKVGDESISMDELFENIDINIEDIIYSFNSSESCFMFMKNGSFIHSYLNKNYKNDRDVKLSSRIHDLPKNKERNTVNRPISTRIVPNGCVVEYFDKVILMQNGNKIILENKGVTAIKTYPASIRYRNLITIFDGENLSIHSLFPLEF